MTAEVPIKQEAARRESGRATDPKRRQTRSRRHERDSSDSSSAYTSAPSSPSSASDEDDGRGDFTPLAPPPAGAGRSKRSTRAPSTFRVAEQQSKRSRKAPRPARASVAEEPAERGALPPPVTQSSTKIGPRANEFLKQGIVEAGSALEAGEKLALLALGQAVSLAFITERAAWDDSTRPRYPSSSSHLKGPDLELLKALLEAMLQRLPPALAFTSAELNGEARRQLRVNWDRVGDCPHPAALPLLAGPSGSPAPRSPPTDPRPSVSRDLDKAVYAPPRGFSWRALPLVDLRGQQAARRSLALAGARRFRRLRDEIPGPAREVYERRSSHLRGADLLLIDRVNAEFRVAFGRLFEQLGYATGPAFTQLWTSRLRLGWDRARDEVVDPEIALCEAAVPGGALGDGGDDPEGGPVLGETRSTPATPQRSAGSSKAPSRGSPMLSSSSSSTASERTPDAAATVQPPPEHLEPVSQFRRTTRASVSDLGEGISFVCVLHGE